MSRRLRTLDTAILAILASSSLTARVEAYIGPGAGGGASSGIGIGGLLIILIACGLGLCVLCGLIALAISIRDRLKTWSSGRQKQARATDPFRS